MRLWRVMTVLLLAGVVVLAGCKKKPKATPPPQSQAPTLTQPEPQLPPTEPTQPPPQPASPETAPAKPPAIKPKPAPKKPVASNSPAPTTPKPNKTVVDNGGTGNEGGQLSAAIPDGAAAQQRSSTAQLLEYTEANLKSITRPLTTTEGEMVVQIQSYVRQSRLASADGDTERAYNLALKARLLSDELVKRK